MLDRVWPGMIANHRPPELRASLPSAMRIRWRGRGTPSHPGHLQRRGHLGVTTTFDIVPWTPAEQLSWLDRHQGAHPAVVAVDEPDGERSLGRLRVRSPPFRTAPPTPPRSRTPSTSTGPPGPRDRPGDPRGAGPLAGPARLPHRHRPHRGPQRGLHRAPPGVWVRAGRHRAGGRPQARPVARRGRAAADALSGPLRAWPSWPRSPAGSARHRRLDHAPERRRRSTPSSTSSAGRHRQTGWRGSAGRAAPGRRAAR